MNGPSAPSLRGAGVYGNHHLNPPLSLPPRQLPAASNSLHGALSIRTVSPALPTDQITSQAATAGTNNLNTLQPVADGPARMVVTPLDKEMQRQLDDYNRSITLVIWYKAHRSPLRIQHTNTTFPCFQLQQLTAVVNDLSIGHSYIDTYDPHSCTWEQHTTESVRLVASQQRLLYRMRKSLLEGLEESECPGLGEELSKQAQFKAEVPVKTDSQIPQKRPLPDSSPVGPPAKVHVTESFIQDANSSPSPTTSLTRTPLVLRQSLPPPAMMASPPTMASTPSASNCSSFQLRHYTGPPISTSRSKQATTTTAAPAPTRPTLTSSSSATSAATSTTSPIPRHTTIATPSTTKSSPAASSSTNASNSTMTSTNTLATMPASSPTSVPYHTHPPLKRWPNDYTVSEISAGFDAMDNLTCNPVPQHLTTNDGPNGTKNASGLNANGGLTQKAAFERVFGSRYVKSTVCRHRGLWRKADRSIREQFEKMGSDDKGVWGEFVRKIEGRGRGSASSTSTAAGAGAGETGMYDSSTPVLGTVPLVAALGQQVRSNSGREKNKPEDDEPVMASLS